ncbi:probable G-protein coupled receptor 148 [Myripristis murdjan]|uniref:probable G-protein coupled receptor 148 n=1 Tax=Myripristis murdjan TaxID=586833 RepID=UPI00117608E9|nr:probable G-protein coupled receptor 148 [Myripristis murdjan]
MTSPIKMANITLEWVQTLQRWHLQLFLIPTALVTLATLLTSPVLMACICLSRALRQETRYLLVANTLAADLIFLILNLTKVLCNTLTAEMPWRLCELLTAVTVTTHSCAILTVTLMVADTFAAVRWPLHYRELLPPARTHCILLVVWAVAALYPFSLVIMMEVGRESPPEKMSVCLVLISLGFIEAKNTVGVHIYFFVAATVCILLILYCYIRLYMVTKTHGIWQRRFSRARVTLLAHGVLLLLYFAPGALFTVELYLLKTDGIGQDVHVWINTVNMCIFMLLPRLFAPFLYGMRYREISDTLLQLLHRHRQLSQVTVP